MRIRFALTLAIVAAGLVSSAEAAVIGFDEITTSTGTDSITPVPNGYDTLNWNNFDTVSADAYPGTGYAAGVISGDYAAFNGYGDTASLSSPTEVDITSVWLTASTDSNDTVEIQGYRDGGLIYDVTEPISPTPTLATLDFNSVDGVTFANADTGESFVIDNITSSVPEPASGTVIAGAAGVLLTRRRRALRSM